MYACIHFESFPKLQKTTSIITVKTASWSQPYFVCQKPKLYHHVCFPTCFYPVTNSHTYTCSGEDLYDLFGRYGAIRQIRLGNDNKTKGTAFVVYEDVMDVSHIFLRPFSYVN
jgi:RNA recognition motif-containing protein